LPSASRLTCASRSWSPPDYLGRRAGQTKPHDLWKHACIGYRQAASGALYRWEFERGADRLDVTVKGPLTLDDPDLMVAAALDGLGLAHAIDQRVANHLAVGRLVRVLEDWCQPFPSFFLYYPSRHQMPAALRPLIDFLRVGD
jgi:DNA-binding transcriptional LysR family regulator